MARPVTRVSQPFSNSVHTPRNGHAAHAQLVLMFFVCILAVGLAGCPIDPVVQSINNAISTLQTQSTNWQATLQQLQTELIAEGQSTLSNEVQSVLNRGIATGSAEFRCDVSFLGNQLAQALKDILADYQHKPRPGQPPHFCTVDPSAVDLGLPPDRRTTLNLNGFNFTASAIHVAVVDQNGSKTTPAPGIFTVPTEFLATLNIRDYPFTSTSAYVSFMLPAGEEQRVSIIQPATTGHPGQPCTQPGNVCDAGSGCLNNTCTTCPVPGDFRRQVFATQPPNDEFAGNNCTGVNEDRTYGGMCDGGFVRDEPASSHLRVVAACDVCTATPRWNNSTMINPSPNDCTLTVHYNTPSDCFKGIRVHIQITESKPVPQGCPSF